MKTYRLILTPFDTGNLHLHTLLSITVEYELFLPPRVSHRSPSYGSTQTQRATLTTLFQSHEPPFIQYSGCTPSGPHTAKIYQKIHRLC